MTRTIHLSIFFLLILQSGLSSGQEIGSMHWMDNNHALATDTGDWKWHRAIKEIKTGKGEKSSVLSFGGEDREQFRYYSHLNFGDVAPGVNDEEIYLQHRLLLHGDLRFADFLRLFIQLNSCHANGRNAELHQVDRDDLGVMQAFADLNFNGPVTIQVRLGRQEFSYGMERILALRDGPTIRQNFDGARIRMNYRKTRWDMILAQPVRYNTGVFDNTRIRNEHIYGSYISTSVFKANGADIYYFKAAFQNAVFAADTADGNRHYMGFRLSKMPGSFSYDLEFTWQSGNHGSKKVRAWHLSSQIAYRFNEIPLKPRILLRESVFSGDENNNDGIINTFRPISSRPPVYDLTPIGPANIILLSPEVDFILSKNLSVTFRLLNVSRYSTYDGVYTSDMRKMTRTWNAGGRHVINGVACDILYIPNKHVTLLLYGGLFKPGNYIRNTGEGHNLEAISLRAHYKF